MASDNAVINQTIDDVKGVLEFAKSNNTTTRRVALDKINIRLPMLQKRLDDKRQEESLLKAKLLTLIDSAVLATKYQAGLAQTIDPVQSYDYLDINLNDPTQSVHYDLMRLEQNQPGLKELRSSLEKVNYEIKTLSRLIRELNDESNKINEVLNKNKTTDKGVKDDTVEADKYQKSRMASVYYLLQLAQVYHNQTVDPNDISVRRYPVNDVKLTKDLMIIQQTFRAHAMSYPDLLTPSDPEVKGLNVADPGDSNNIALLVKTVGTFKSSNNIDVPALESEVQKYVNSLTGTIQDSASSKGLIRKSFPGPAPGNSLLQATKSYPIATVNFLGNKWNVGWELPSMLECVTNWWQKKYSAKFEGLPPCTTPTLTEAENNQMNDNMQKEATKASATTKVQEATGAVTGNKPTKTQGWLSYFKENYPDAQYGVVPNSQVEPTLSEVAPVYEKEMYVDDFYWYVTTGTGRTAGDASNADSSFCMSSSFYVNTTVKGKTTKVPYITKDNKTEKTGRTIQWIDSTTVMTDSTGRLPLISNVTKSYDEWKSYTLRMPPKSS